jgi:predicted permease
MRKRLRLILRGLFNRDRFEREMAAEMSFHMKAFADDLERGGMTREDAERRARVEFGGVDAAQEDCRQARGLQAYDELRQDLRYAVRQMIKSPGFTVAAIVSLSLGIGANTAIFSLMDAALYRIVPIANPEELYFLGHRGSRPKPNTSANYPLLERYRTLDVFSGVTAYSQYTFPVATSDGVEPVNGQFVSGNYHAIVGARFAAGRGFSTEPDRPSGRAPIAVISDRFWERRFARSPDVIGQTLLVDGRPTTIVGVTAPGFHGLVSGSRLDISVPMYVRAIGEPTFLSARDGWVSLTLVARRNPDVPLERANAAVDAIFQRYWMEPENEWAREKGAPSRTGELLPAARGSEQLRENYRTALLVLMAMVALVLLIACSNVANLLLARATVRAREVALRMSIGAGRARLIRQHLTESLLLSLLGGALGLAIAAPASKVILSLLDTGRRAVLLDVSLNARVLIVSAAISIATGIVFGLAPALRATRVDLAPALKDIEVARSRRFRLATGKSLVVAQLALCVVLVATAALLIETLRKLKHIETGFERANIVMFNVETYNATFTTDRRIAFYSTLQERLQAIPGVSSVSLAKRSPIDMGTERRRFEVPGVAPRAGQEGVSGNVVTPGYFQAFGIRVLRGRGFTEADRAGAPNVTVISEAVAKSYFDKVDPLGRTVSLGGEKTAMTIVGIVADVRHERLREPPPPMLYTALAQPTESFDGTFGYPGHQTAILRTTADPSTIAASARQIVRDLDPSVPVSYVRSMEQQLDAALMRERLLAHLSGAFGTLALVLAFVGLYGLMSYSVAQRTREIGIRMALGATRPLVLWQVLRETTVVSVVGLAIGMAVAVASTRVISAFLFDLTPRDPATLSIVAALLLGTTLIAGYLPARRAALLDPTRALKTE